MPRINLSDVPDTGFDPIPPGDYTVEMLTFERKTSKSGNPYLNCEYVVLTGEYAGRKLFDMISLTEAAAWKIKAWCKAADWPRNLIIDTDNDVQLRQIFLGIEILVRVKTEKQEGYDPRARIDRFLPPKEKQEPKTAPSPDMEKPPVDDDDEILF